MRYLLISILLFGCQAPENGRVETLDSYGQTVAEQMAQSAMSEMNARSCPGPEYSYNEVFRYMADHYYAAYIAGQTRADTQVNVIDRTQVVIDWMHTIPCIVAGPDEDDVRVWLEGQFQDAYERGM